MKKRQGLRQTRCFFAVKSAKETGQIAVYELDVPIDGHMIFCLRIRQQFNPELRYFVVGEKFYTAHKQEISASLKKRRVLKDKIEIMGAYCRTGKINRRKEVQNMGKPKKKPLPAYFKSRWVYRSGKSKQPAERRCWKLKRRIPQKTVTAEPQEGAEDAD